MCLNRSDLLTMSTIFCYNTFQPCTVGVPGCVHTVNLGSIGALDGGSRFHMSKG